MLQLVAGLCSVEDMIPVYTVHLPHQFTYQWTLRPMLSPASCQQHFSAQENEEFIMVLSFVYGVRCGVPRLYGSLGMSTLF